MPNDAFHLRPRGVRGQLLLAWGGFRRLRANVLNARITSEEVSGRALTRVEEYVSCFRRRRSSRPRWNVPCCFVACPCHRVPPNWFVLICAVAVQVFS